MLRAGARNRRIVIQRSTMAESAIVGAPDLVWSTHKTVWAAKKPVGGRENLQLSRETAAEVADWEILYMADISPKDRINEGGKIWDILSIVEINLREGLRITAEARA